jgi:hypothetical protein
VQWAWFSRGYVTVENIANWHFGGNVGATHTAMTRLRTRSSGRIDRNFANPLMFSAPDCERPKGEGRGGVGSFSRAQFLVWVTTQTLRRKKLAGSRSSSQNDTVRLVGASRDLLHLTKDNMPSVVPDESKTKKWEEAQAPQGGELYHVWCMEVPDPNAPEVMVQKAIPSWMNQGIGATIGKWQTERTRFSVQSGSPAILLQVFTSTLDHACKNTFEIRTISLFC